MNKFFNTTLNHLYNHYILWSFLVVVLYNLFDATYYAVFGGGLFYTDTDCYTRALRVLDWLNDFQWGEKIFPYSNVPNGFVLHFTRVSDIIWVALSLPFMLFEPLKNAVFHGGMLFSPLFFALSLATIFWGLRPYLPNCSQKQKIYALTFFITVLLCAKLTNIFDFSRPDHHSAMFFIFCFNVAVILRATINPQENHWFSAGFIAGLSLWFATAAEGTFLLGLILLPLCIDWIFSPFNSHKLMLYGSGIMFATTIAWLINPPYEGLFFADNGRLSVIHVTMTALLFLCFFSFDKLKSQTKFGRLTVLMTECILSTLILIGIFGIETLFKPMYPEQISSFLLQYVTEMQPLYRQYYLLFSLIAGLLIVGYLLYNKIKHNQNTTTLISLIILTLLICLIWVRFYQYYLVVFIYGSGILIFELSSLSQRDLTAKTMLFLYVVGNLFALTGFRSEPQNRRFPEITGNVATDIFSAPQFSFDRNVKTIAAPYHTNIEGITDNNRLFFSDNEIEIKNIIQKHQINYIYLPQDVTDYYALPSQNTDKFYGKIITGQNLYPWLKSIQIHNKNGVLYKVEYDSF